MDDDFEGPRFGERLPDDDLERLIMRPTAFPGIMLAAGVLWILAGLAYIGLFGLGRLLQLPFNSNELWLLAGALFFVHDGIQLIRGRFRDPLADGIITILIGLFFLGHGFVAAAPGPNIFAIVVGAFFGLVFLVPGVLVLIGRKKYLAWKAENGL